MAGFVLVLGVAPTVVLVGIAYPLSFGIILAVIIPGIVLLVVGATLLDDEYRRLALPDLALGPSGTVVVRRRRRRAQIPAWGAIALCAASGLATDRAGPFFGAWFLLAALGLVLVSLYLFFRAFQLERGLKVQGAVVA